MEMSVLADRASMNAFVPDLAMVPRLLIMSALVIPMPESMMVSVLESLSGMSLMPSSVLPSSFEASVRDSYLASAGSKWDLKHWLTNQMTKHKLGCQKRKAHLILSRASDEFEISSLKKISLLLHRET